MEVASSRFPDPRAAPADAPVAVGGDLDTATLLDAYRHGIFPWPSGRHLWWWSPDPRAVLPLEAVHVSRTLRRTLARGTFTTTLDADFAGVVAACADRPEGTWITPAVARAYQRLHHAGVAHSLEVWAGRELVGGIYGLALGGAFMGESMFHRATDASKVALVRLAEHLRDRGFALFDVQLMTPHLATMGAVAVPRAAFLDQLAAALTRPASFTAPAASPAAPGPR